jgi:hypothetical protein
VIAVDIKSDRRLEDIATHITPFARIASEHDIAV